ncbi:MAG: hypothetical protein ACR2QL_11530 [Woeseiaceae bacterium]
MSDTKSSIRRTLIREVALLVGLLLLGLVLLPIAIFVVGSQVFGDYGAAGFSGFFNMLGGKLRNGDWVAWFLVLAPYFAWQVVRMTAFFWRKLGRDAASSTHV